MKLFVYVISSPFSPVLVILQLILLFVSTAHLAVGALRRNPRVYNALITTDQNLTPSRTFPVIQPHIEYPSFAGGPLDAPWLSPYNPYYGAGLYASQAASIGASYFGGEYPLGLGGPQLTALDGRHFGHAAAAEAAAAAAANAAHHAGQPNGDQQSDEVESVDEHEGSSDDDAEGKSARGDQSSNDEEPKSDTNEQPSKHNRQNNVNHQQNNPQPFPVNQFGLPPNLVPINPLYNPWNQQRHDPINLSPYPYQSYPLIYDHVPSYHPTQFLPPYGLFTPELVAAGRRTPSSGKRNKQPPGDKTNRGSGDKKDQEQLQNQNADEQKMPNDDTTEQNQQQDDQQQGDQQQQDGKQQKQGSQQQQNSEQQQPIQSDQNQPKQQQRRQAKQDRHLAQNSAMNFKNFDPINRNVPDVPPPPPPSGAKDAVV